MSKTWKHRFSLIFHFFEKKAQVSLRQAHPNLGGIVCILRCLKIRTIKNSYLFVGTHHWGVCALPNPPCSQGASPPEPPSLISLNMGTVGHDTCTMIIAHVSCPRFSGGWSGGWSPPWKQGGLGGNGYFKRSLPRWNLEILKTIKILKSWNLEIVKSWNLELLKTLNILKILKSWILKISKIPRSWTLEL